MRYAAIEGYAHPYRISEAGVVESLRFGAWTPLTPTMNGHRHVVVHLRKNGGGQAKRSVAKLMADAFLGGVPAGYGVFHKRTRRSGTTRWRICLFVPSASVEGTRVARPS